MQRIFPDLSSLRPSFRKRLLTGLVTGVALWGGTAGLSCVARASEAIQPAAHSRQIPDFVELVKQVKPAVVTITSKIRLEGVGMGGGFGADPFPFPFPFPFRTVPDQGSQRYVEGRGSGFVISQDGYIVTNNHVVKGAVKVTVTMDDGTTYDARIIGRDGKTDLALLKVKPAGKLPFIELGDSSHVEPGEWVIAVGNPYGLGGTVTAGIVSAMGRDIGEGPYDSFIQVDAPINKGNSGGPLFTQDGKVVGVNTAILSPSGGSIGIGFAIPSETVKNVVAQLREHGHVTRGFLGVAGQRISPSMANALNMKIPPGGRPKGVLVASVVADGPAEKSGIRAGDVIIQMGDHVIENPHDLAVRVATLKPGTKETFRILRNGKEQSLEITIQNLKDMGHKGQGASAGGARLGVALSSLTAELRQQLGVGPSVSGVVVMEVQPNSLAEQAGIRPGDIIQAIGSKKISNSHDAALAIQGLMKENKSVLLRVLRGGQGIFVAITPGGPPVDHNAAPDDDEED